MNVLTQWDSEYSMLSWTNQRRNGNSFEVGSRRRRRRGRLDFLFGVMLCVCVCLFYCFVSTKRGRNTARTDVSDVMRYPSKLCTYTDSENFGL